MADSSSQSIVVAAPVPAVAAVICDFPRYPEWAAAVREAEVLEEYEDGYASQVRFVLDAGPVRDEYVLAYEWDGDAGVSWRTAEGGRMVSALAGSYRLAERPGGGTEVTYELAVELKVPMIGLIRRRAEKVIVDTALKGLKRRVEGR